MQKKLVLGLAPARRAMPRLTLEVANRSKRAIESKLNEWGVNYVGLDGITSDGFLVETTDVDRIAAAFRARGVNALFAPHCNFGTEGAVALLAREMGVPVLLWGPLDEAPVPEYERPDDAQCGLFATTAVLRRNNVPYTYVTNCTVDSPIFERGVRGFLGAAAAARAFHGARIGQVGTRPPAFWTMIENEGELLERWGIQVVPTTLVEIAQLQTQKLAANSTELRDTVELFKQTADFSGVAPDAISRMAALKMALVEFYEQQQLDALAIYCHRPFRIATGVPLCFVNSILGDMGISVGCEADIHGVLSSVMARAATLYSQPVIFADLTIRHPTNPNAELLWHCGNFPPSLAREPKARKVHLHDGLPSAGTWEVKGGDVTIVRLGGDHGNYALFMGQARGTKGPETYGTYLWVEMDCWPKWEEKLMNGPYVHHVAAVHGRIAPLLYEACKYIPGLAPDPIEPSAEEIRAYWRGDDIAEQYRWLDPKSIAR
jgi:L-fucose isomerase-like protein